MENLANLLLEWEIQLLVVLSFTIQIFLFFTGGLRRRSTNMLLSFSIWIAYLGADVVAVYALGYLSRHEHANPLAVFWAPFLLVHLGGQDTITAFSMEDNNLWLRHLLNLAMQTVLAVYVFWKSIGRHDVNLLVSGIFVFFSGIIKYGERIRSLRCGVFESLEGSSEVQFDTQDTAVVESYPMTVILSMLSMQGVLNIFVGRTRIHGHRRFSLRRSFKEMEIELALMYNDLYTKALVLRRRSGIILRCISLICAVVAFIVFISCYRSGWCKYNRADVAITYLLFIGGLFLEVSQVINFMASPWTWLWFKAKRCNNLAWFSWFLFSSDLIGWPEKRPQWSNAMGQYNLYGLLTGSSFTKQPLINTLTNLASFIGVDRWRRIWMTKLFDREYVKVDGRVVECLLDGVIDFRNPQNFPMNTGHPFIDNLSRDNDDFGLTIACMHIFTEIHLSKYSCSDVEANLAATDEYTDAALVEDCRKLSRYMMYLMVAAPSLLPLDFSSVATLQQVAGNWDRGWEQRMKQGNPEQSKETLMAIKNAWIWLIIYAASRSRPQTHAAHLAGGGELLTFVWLNLSLVYSSLPVRDPAIRLPRLR